MTPLQSIRKNCLECSNNQPSEVKNCIIKDCHLYAFRLGNNPHRKGIGGNPGMNKNNTTQVS